MSWPSAEIDIYRQCKLPHVSSIAIERQLLLIGHSLRIDCPLNRILASTRPVASHQPLLSSIKRRIPYPINEWGVLALDRKGWSELARTAAESHEEKLQHKLLVARRHRWTSLPSLSHRVFLIIVENISASLVSSSSSADFFIARGKCDQLLSPFAMDTHLNVFTRQSNAARDKRKNHQ